MFYKTCLVSDQAGWHNSDALGLNLEGNVRGSVGSKGCETSSIPYFLDN